MAGPAFVAVGTMTIMPAATPDHLIIMFEWGGCRKASAGLCGAGRRCVAEHIRKHCAPSPIDLPSRHSGAPSRRKLASMAAQRVGAQRRQRPTVAFLAATL